MLETIITNKTRIKLIQKFFLNKNTTGYLRSLEAEFNESSNAIRVELNRLEAADLLFSSFDGNKKIYRANSDHPLFEDLHSILRKTVEIDKVIERIISKLGHLKEAYLIGELANGKSGEIIDLLLVGESINSLFVSTLIQQAEKKILRKIRFLCISDAEKIDYLSNKNALLIWQQENK